MTSGEAASGSTADVRYQGRGPLTVRDGGLSIAPVPPIVASVPLLSPAPMQPEAYVGQADSGSAAVGFQHS